MNAQNHIHLFLGPVLAEKLALIAPDESPAEQICILLQQRDALKEACESALIALNNPGSENWRLTAITDINDALNRD